MSQPSDKPTTKRADELRIGERFHDGRGFGPVEVAYVQPHRDAHGDERVLIVTEDAAVSYHPADDVMTMATEAEFADAQRHRDRVRVIADIRALADWYEQHPGVPAPISVQVNISLGATRPDNNTGKREAIQAIAAAMGVEVVERTKTIGATFVLADYNPAIIEVKATMWLDDEPAPAQPEPEPEAEQTLPHRHASAWKGGSLEGGDCGAECACGVTYDGFDSLAEASELLDKHIAEGNAAAAAMLEKPLDELPDDFGADHDPTDCECEDCDLQVQHAETDEPVTAGNPS